MDKRKDLIFLYIVIFFTIVIYFLLRLVFRDSVFFNFDMPRLAIVTQDFIKNGTFLTSQSYMQESSWLNVPWGPALVYFYALFFKLSSDPLVVSNLLSIFHITSIIFIIKLGWKFFSPTVGVISGLLLSTNPYWIIYSRIIYQPAPVITFIVISMYLLLSVIKDRNRTSTVLLPISWIVLFQMYIPTYSFIFVSIVALLLNYKKIHIKSILVGLFASLLICVPTIKFYVDNPIYIDRFITAPSKFTPPEKKISERLVKVGISFLQIPLGGKFEWQTGYSFQDFNSNIGFFSYICYPIFLVFGIVLITNFKNIIMKHSNISMLLLFSWSVCPFISLLVLWVTDIVPRYFLTAIPPILIMIAVSINSLMYKYKNSLMIRYFLWVVTIAISIYWSVYFIKYDIFIKNYNYPRGRFNDIAETPYIHFKNAMDWADSDAKRSGCEEYSITNNKNELNYDIWMETRYVWQYVYKYKFMNKENLNKNCSYLIEYEYTAKSLNINNYEKFGPFVVFKYFVN